MKSATKRLADLERLQGAGRVVCIHVTHDEHDFHELTPEEVAERRVAAYAEAGPKGIVVEYEYVNDWKGLHDAQS